jgi:hypothetical protein
MERRLSQLLLVGTLLAGATVVGGVMAPKKTVGKLISEEV